MSPWRLVKWCTTRYEACSRTTLNMCHRHCENSFRPRHQLFLPGDGDVEIQLNVDNGNLQGFVNNVIDNTTGFVRLPTLTGCTPEHCEPYVRMITMSWQSLCVTR